MKKSLLALAVLGTVAGTASAQSSVTLYGAFMLSAQRVTGVPLKLDIANGTNWVGVRGSEDLGNGLKANFDIQWRYSPESGGNDGSNNARPVFQGKTAAGLSGAFGTVDVGRQLSPFQINEAKGDPFFGGGTISLVQGSLDLLVSQYATDPLTSGSTALGARAGTGGVGCALTACGDGGGLARTDMIKYDTPNFAGFTGSVAYGLKNSAASGATIDQQKSFNSFWLQYNAGPLYVGLGRERNRQNDKVVAVNAWYDFGVAKISAGYGTLDKSAKFNSVTGALIATNDGTKGKRWQAGVQVPFGAFTAKLGYGQVKDETTGAKSTNKIGIGGDYALSKRTWVFASYAHNKNKTTSPSITTKGADLGLRHVF